MRAAPLVALGVVAYAVFLAATIPARVVAAHVASETRGAVRLHEVKGSAWDGAARAIVTLPATSFDVDVVTWRWRPASLAAGRFAFEVDATLKQLEVRGEVGRGLAAWEARDLRAGGNAAAFATIFPPLGAWRPEGSVTAHVPAASWTPTSLTGEGRIEWRGAALGLSEVKPLGHYRADLRGDGGDARLTLTTLEGPLRVAGQGALTPRGRLAFDGEARAEGPSAPALQPLLDLLGPRRPDGSRQIGVR